MTSQPHDLSALEQAAAIRAGEISSVELTEHYLRRVERLDAKVGAFITITGTEALEAAREADETMRRSDDKSTLPPFLGVPTAIKDLNLTAGVRTTMGSAAFEDFVPDTSDEVVLRLERAGLVSIGKTNTPEFGSPCYTEPDVAPPARTPYDLDRGAGGSSGGAGAAVSAGLVPWAQGSDGGGSIRIPASVCGLVGLKPSRGRVSTAPMYGDLIGLGIAGPLTRTVRDAAAMLDLLAGPAVGDPQPSPPPPPPASPTSSGYGTFLSWCDRTPGPLRVARFSGPLIADVDVAPQCLSAYERASTLLADLGHRVEDVEPPLSHDAVPVFETCWAVMSATSVVPPERRSRLRPLTRWLAERAAEVPSVDFALAAAELRRVAAVALRMLAPYDLLLTPTLASLPAPVGSLRDDEDPAQDFENQKRFTPYTSAWNVIGMPAISLPVHWTDSGLPVGVMLAARPGAEHVLLSAAAQVEAAAPWRDHHPACW
jgi:amidase